MKSFFRNELLGGGEGMKNEIKDENEASYFYVRGAR